MHFLPNQKRLLHEKKELEERLHGLSHFIRGRHFETVPLYERNLRLKQRKAMKEYLDILNELVTIWKEQG
jgi:hypothetical protein